MYGFNPDADGNGVTDAATSAVDNLHYYAALDTVISTSAPFTNNSFVLYRGDKITIQPYLYKGDNVTYELIGTLPVGLTFSGTTGQISGTPTEFSATTLYSVRAFNPATTFTAIPTVDFYIKVNDFMEVENVTTNATSFIMHKEGQGRIRSRCLITQDQIDGTSLTPKDINCFVDAGELDLYNSGLSLKANIGKGMCEHIRYAPYFFYKHQYKSSNPTTGGSTVPQESRAFYTLTGDYMNTTCQDATYNPTVLLNTNGYAARDRITSTYVSKATCASDYATLNSDSRFPNCDDGKYLNRDVAFLFVAANCSGTATDCSSIAAGLLCTAQAGCTSAATCTGTATACTAMAVGAACTAQAGCTSNADSCTVTPGVDTEVSCGGDIKNCVEGPAKETDSLNPPYTTSVISATSNGLVNTWKYTAPIGKSFGTNKYLANYTNANKCDDSNSDTVRGNDYGYNSTYWGDHATNSYSYLLTTYVDPFSQTNPFYTFYCLDAAFDIVARIRVITREWNKDFKATSGIDLSNPGATYMDNTTVDPFGSNYNNRADWDDAGAVLSAVTPAACIAPAAGTGALINTTPTPDTSNFTTPMPFPALGL
jgi:hypothetical protein